MIKKQSQNFEIKIAPSFEDDTATSVRKVRTTDLKFCLKKLIALLKMRSFATDLQLVRL